MYVQFTYLTTFNIVFKCRLDLSIQLMSIRHFLNEAVKFPLEEINELDFSNYSYSPPLLGVFFSSFINKNSNFSPVNYDRNEYLGTINFPGGIKLDEIIDWKVILESYRTKSYLPIICFSTSKEESVTFTRDNIISHVNAVIRSITNIPTNYFSAISYLISELTDNIVEHSKSETGWISFQYYRNKGFLDLCIADTGIGLLKSYQEYRGEKDFSHITNHLEALDNVIQGNSTKHLNERGFGVHTSREIIINGLGGTLCLCGRIRLFGVDSRFTG